MFIIDARPSHASGHEKSAGNIAGAKQWRSVGITEQNTTRSASKRRGSQAYGTTPEKLGRKLQRSDYNEQTISNLEQEVRTLSELLKKAQYETRQMKQINKELLE